MFKKAALFTTTVYTGLILVIIFVIVYFFYSCDPYTFFNPPREPNLISQDNIFQYTKGYYSNVTICGFTEEGAKLKTIEIPKILDGFKVVELTNTYWHYGGLLGQDYLGVYSLENSRKSEAEVIIIDSSITIDKATFWGFPNLKRVELTSQAFLSFDFHNEDTGYYDSSNRSPFNFCLVGDNLSDFQLILDTNNKAYANIIINSLIDVQVIDISFSDIVIKENFHVFSQYNSQIKLGNNVKSIEAPLISDNYFNQFGIVNIFGIYLPNNIVFLSQDCFQYINTTIYVAPQDKETYYSTNWNGNNKIVNDFTGRQIIYIDSNNSVIGSVNVQVGIFNDFRDSFSEIPDVILPTSYGFNISNIFTSYKVSETSNILTTTGINNTPYNQEDLILQNKVVLNNNIIIILCGQK